MLEQFQKLEGTVSAEVMTLLTAMHTRIQSLETTLGIKNDPVGTLTSEVVTAGEDVLKTKGKAAVYEVLAEIFAALAASPAVASMGPAGAGIVTALIAIVQPIAAATAAPVVTPPA